MQLRFFSFIAFIVTIALSISAQGSDHYTFHENFNDNAKQWLVANQQGIVAHVADGRYSIEHQNKTGAGLFWNYNVHLDQTIDFDITAKLKQLAGDTAYGYGLTWGGKDGSNFYAFTISSNQSINIYKFEQGVLIDILPMKIHNGIINKIGFNNELKIKKRENNISFYVNGAYIHSYPFEAFFGNTLGFVLNSTMKVSVEQCTATNEIVDENNKVPVVTWFSPSKKLTISNENHYHIEAGIKSDISLTKIALYTNDRLIGDISSFHKLRNITDQEFDEIISEKVVLLNGINEIRIVMEDYQGNITESKRIVKIQHEASEHVRHDHAILFASDEYTNWGNLANPINDANTIAEELELLYGFEVEVITNASNIEIMAKLKEYANKKYNKTDQLFVFFAGHGKYDKDFGEGYVVCTNSEKEESDPGNTTFLGHSTLRTVIDHIPCNHIFLMMDICFGGTFDPRLGNSIYRGENDGIYGNMAKDMYIYTTLKYKTRKYLTSGGARYVQDGTPGNHSPFVRKFLESLRSNGGEDKILTLAEIYQNVERLKTTPQFGEFGSNEPGSEFLFVRE